MSPRFEGRAAAWAMTGITVTDTTGIMRPGAAHEGCGCITEVAVQAGRNVGWYGIHHADRGITIMTRDAIVDDAGMIEGRRFEGTRVMTDTAILIGRNMADIFRRREAGSVTGCTVIYDADVIEGCRLKARGLVAVSAITVGRHMAGVFSDGGISIVTRSTGIIVTDQLVIKLGTGKGRGVMAHRAILGGRNVVA